MTKEIKINPTTSCRSCRLVRELALETLTSYDTTRTALGRLGKQNPRRLVAVSPQITGSIFSLTTPPPGPPAITEKLPVLSPAAQSIAAGRTQDTLPWANPFEDPATNPVPSQVEPPPDPENPDDDDNNPCNLNERLEQAESLLCTLPPGYIAGVPCGRDGTLSPQINPETGEKEVIFRPVPTDFGNAEVIAACKSITPKGGSPEGLPTLTPTPPDSPEAVLHPPTPLPPHILRQREKAEREKKGNNLIAALGALLTGGATLILGKRLSNNWRRRKEQEERKARRRAIAAGRNAGSEESSSPRDLKTTRRRWEKAWLGRNRSQYFWRIKYYNPYNEDGKTWTLTVGTPNKKSSAIKRAIQRGKKQILANLKGAGKFRPWHREIEGRMVGPAPNPSEDRED